MSRTAWIVLGLSVLILIVTIVIISVINKKTAKFQKVLQDFSDEPKDIAVEYDGASEPDLKEGDPIFVMQN